MSQEDENYMIANGFKLQFKKKVVILNNSKTPGKQDHFWNIITLNKKKSSSAYL